MNKIISIVLLVGAVAVGAGVVNTHDRLSQTSVQAKGNLFSVSEDIHNALFMHCLPAHRHEEISEDMLDDPRSVVWEEAENRLHVQKALIEFLLNNSN